MLEEIKKLYLIERQMDEEAYDFEQKLKHDKIIRSNIVGIKRVAAG
ncbi:MAG: hypothetical protein IPL46_26765 [Saprospiraceae bacterium]|nr:hypothetical protein [Saprospiraceae bacterium]